MYELRRTYVTESGKERLVASVLQRAGTMLVEAGLREPFHVAFNSGTCPGEKQRVIMTWTAAKLESALRADNIYPAGYFELWGTARPHVLDTWLEIHELMNDEKMVDM